jgi:hypothetical protein
MRTRQDQRIRTRRPFEDTVVSADKSKAEIRAMLLKYGVEQFGVLEGPGRAVIAFTHQGRTIRIEVPLPDTATPALRVASSQTAASKREAQAKYAQEERRLWRVTFSTWAAPQLERQAERGQLPPLLPGSRPEALPDGNRHRE